MNKALQNGYSQSSQLSKAQPWSNGDSKLAEELDSTSGQNGLDWGQWEKIVEWISAGEDSNGGAASNSDRPDSVRSGSDTTTELFSPFQGYAIF